MCFRDAMIRKYTVQMHENQNYTFFSIYIVIVSNPDNKKIVRAKEPPDQR